MEQNKKLGSENRCPKCGATDILLNPKTGKLKCRYCRTTFDNKSVNGATDISQLTARKINAGATNIIPNTDTILTFKCGSCGAQIVVNTEESTSKKCHWCRHVLSINETIPNGAVPDMVLPFKLDKATAEKNIKDFVSKRQFFAHPKFKKEFTTENILGAYLPYMVVDVNAHARFVGEAEHQTRSYWVEEGSGDHRHSVHYYDAAVYNITRDFDILIDDLTIESSKDKIEQNNLVNTTNIINAIMPFDTENCVAWDANFLRGYASEKRDTNVEELIQPATIQAQDITRFKVKESMEYYDRGARWNSESIQIKGAEWKAAYLPVWLYSYLQDDGKMKLLHYVAVNARNGKTMGSVPLYKGKLLGVSVLIELASLIFGGCWTFWWFSNTRAQYAGFFGFLPGIIFYFVIKNKYRNAKARHKHECNTKSQIQNLQKTDNYIKERTRLRNSSIQEKNSDVVNGVLAQKATKAINETKNKKG